MARHPIPHSKPYSDATPLLRDPAQLRATAQQDGVLFFKQLLTASEIQPLRRTMLELAAAHGALDADTDPMEGRASVDKAACWGEHPGSVWKQSIYPGIQQLREFHALAQHPHIMRLFETLFGQPVLAMPRNIARMIGPGTERITTPPHQDYWYIKGTEQVWTLWMPLGDCPGEMGGLAVLPGSHHGGKRKQIRAEGAGGNAVADLEEATWLRGPFEAGDLVIFHSLTIHQGLDNRSEKVRISVDYRYQSRSEPVHHQSLEPHLGMLTWEEIYASWPDQNDPLRYYWKAFDLQVLE